MLDLSPLRKFEVLGPDAETLLQLACTRNIRRLAVGQVVYTALCYEHGGMLDDGMVFRLGADNFRWIGGDEYGRQVAARAGGAARAQGLGQILDRPAPQSSPCQGPKSRDILKQIVWTPPASRA